jgi:flagellar hook assembly protein FlgD
MSRGFISDSSFSYASYSDSIGGWGSKGVTIVPSTGVDEPAIPSRLSLHAPSPSPFSGTTTLAFDVPAEAGRLRLAIYNARGQLIRTLVDGFVTPGRCEIVWNGDDAHGLPVTGGVYFAKCEADGVSDTRKLVVVR